MQRHGWLTAAEFLDLAGITAIFPGAISIKYATYVGYKIAGIPGVILANLGNLLPSIILITTAGLLYKKHRGYPGPEGAFQVIRIAVFAMIIVIAF